uniref:Onecut1 protein n=1 Tax=Mus musculus TaxID=10090 RepID=Q8K1C8_MOUSE|nr:Onecut1 protein [Mus musculus]
MRPDSPFANSIDHGFRRRENSNYCCSGLRAEAGNK